MKNHSFQNSDPTGFDSNCAECGKKHRDSIHSVFEYAAWQGGNGEFISAMHSGTTFECDSEMYDYFFGVLPPKYLRNPVKLPNGSLIRSDFGFAEGEELITAFWRIGHRYFGCRTNVMNRDY